MQDFEAKWEKSSGSGWTIKVQSRPGDNKPCSFIVAVKLACYWICSDGRALLGQVTRQSKASINSKGTLSSAGNSKFATQSQAEPDSVFPGKQFCSNSDSEAEGDRKYDMESFSEAASDDELFDASGAAFPTMLIASC